MRNIKAVIFDVDGVLVDSLRANVEFYAALLEKGGYPKATAAEINACFHLPMWQALEVLARTKDKNEIERIWELGHDPAIYPAHLLVFPDSIEQVLVDLHKHYRLAIVTGRVKSGVDTLFSAKNIGKFFDFAVTFEDYANPKPHPEPLQVALNRLNVLPSEAVYIGDSHVDIEAAKAAGIWSIHLSAKKHADATVGITSFSDIPSAMTWL